MSSLFPFVDASLTSTGNKKYPLYSEIAWDFESDKPIVEDNTLKIVYGNEAIKTWIYKAILSSRFSYLIYTFDYGCEAYSLIGKNYSHFLTNAEVKRYLEECLYINPYITQIDVLDVNFNNGKLSAKVKVQTIYKEDFEIYV